jgi:hypothetical protein
METRYCSNCRTEIPEGESHCPQCGEYAGDVFDGRIAKPEKRPVSVTLLALLLLAILGAGYAVWFNRDRLTQVSRKEKPAAPPVKVVADRPGGKKDRAEATRRLIAYFVEERGLKKECVVLAQLQPQGESHRFRAFDRCDQTRLGRWQVRNGEVSRLE